MKDLNYNMKLPKVDVNSGDERRKPVIEKREGTQIEDEKLRALSLLPELCLLQEEDLQQKMLNRF